MSRKCTLSKKRPLFGNNVSHAHNKTKKVQRPNIQKKRIFVAETGKYLLLKVSTHALRTIEKIGLLPYLRKRNISLKSLR